MRAVHELRRWGVVLGVLLAGCAASGPSLREEAEPEASCQQAERDEGETCLALLCDEEVCGFLRCEDVAEAVAERVGSDAAPGSVVKTWANPSTVSVYRPGSSPMRYWGRPLALPEERGAVFIIPWRNHHHHRNLLPSQKQLIAEANERLNRPHEKHHIFPREFVAWFKEKGIDIHQWTMLIEEGLHKRIHRGEKGGPWNDAWRQFKDAKPRASKEEIWAHAWELCVRFGLSAPLQPYYSPVRFLPPIRY
jgi:uncharacterized lipoprotein (TIGR02269 family)